jgi:hypothetical protein
MALQDYRPQSVQLPTWSVSQCCTCSNSWYRRTIDPKVCIYPHGQCCSVALFIIHGIAGLSTSKCTYTHMVSVATCCTFSNSWYCRTIDPKVYSYPHGQCHSVALFLTHGIAGLSTLKCTATHMVSVAVWVLADFSLVEGSTGWALTTSMPS